MCNPRAADTSLVWCLAPMHTTTNALPGANVSIARSSSLLSIALCTHALIAAWRLQVAYRHTSSCARKRQDLEVGHTTQRRENNG
ncbi:hypothetical protein BOTBODRAFT_351441 [Botryobasidium botryosum FD-172 SS1]|uniref:Uncharacterized protein n=1 Tax=Botryobasidium botryosum (strain FD-172 SS1) TaxID=930990 RepID=A0A067MHC4_BOTB1|nr:hypothetical protein BOTBODRAFT_351441 [Botryobasidium botryosum FD-172 SS1]